MNIAFFIWSAETTSISINYFSFGYLINSPHVVSVSQRIYFLFFILKADSRVGWTNNFKCFRVIFSLKKKTTQFPISFNLYFHQKRAPKLPICHLSTKRSVWVYDVTNRTNGFSNFQSYCQVVVYLLNSLAKSCTLFWK